MTIKNNDRNYISKQELRKLKWSEDSMEIICEPDEVFVFDNTSKRISYRIENINNLTEYDMPIICDRCGTSYARRIDHMFPEHSDFTLCIECLNDLGILPEINTEKE